MSCGRCRRPDPGRRCHRRAGGRRRWSTIRSSWTSLIGLRALEAI